VNQLKSASLALMLSALVLLSACANKSHLEGPQQGAKNPTTESVDKSKRADIRLQLAVNYYQQGQYKVALEEVKQALASSPEFADAYSVRALIFSAMGEKDLAEENFLYALKVAPNNSEIANNYGLFLCQNGREKQGIAYFEKVIKDPRYPNPAKVLNNAGSCSLRLKDVVAAERYFRQGFREDPSNPLIAANLAKVSYEKREYVEADFYIQRVLKAEIYAADVLWLGIKIKTKTGDQEAANALGTQLRRRYPESDEYARYKRGAFNE
jgi:type IV pilus assembly protein PilF